MSTAQRLRAIAASLPIIVLAALALHVGYTISQTQKISPQVLRAVPFLYEPGNIAYSIAIGHGFGSPFRADTGPTAWTGLFRHFRNVFLQRVSRSD
jgi:hypothetical protein